MITTLKIVLLLFLIVLTAWSQWTIVDALPEMVIYHAIMVLVYIVSYFISKSKFELSE